MKKSLSEELLGDPSAKLEQANNDFAASYPGETGRCPKLHLLDWRKVRMAFRVADTVIN